MLRQLWRLSRTLQVDGRRMSAPAVYAERRGSTWQLEQADEMGYEGVACVDDASRLAVLLLLGYEVHRLRWALDWARDTLEFVLYMQQPDGSFADFILDWDGRPNLDGPTSRPGGLPYLARSMWALAAAHRVTGEPRYRDAYCAAVTALPEEVRYGDVLAVAVLSAFEMHAAAPDARLLERAETWCEGILGLRRDGLLLNHLDEETPHLWAYIQPGVLALASARYQKQDWLELARTSVDDHLAPLVREGFRRPTTLPYEVSSVVFDCDALHRVTGEARYAELAALARAWFHGRNTASQPVYDPRLGMVFDGIDDGRVNLNSGAESNVEGGLALFDELPWHEYRLGL